METVILPLSEETGERIVSALLRIARALEGTGGQAAMEGDNLYIPYAYVDDDGNLVNTGATIDNDYLTF
jgi:hypothetical protein